MKNNFKTLVFASPLLLFPILLIPYSLLNRHVLVKVLGCGCPKVDELGNIITPDFNANDFTSVFWTLVAVCATVIALLLSRRFKEKPAVRIVYVLAVFAISLLISAKFSTMMMWK